MARSLLTLTLLQLFISGALSAAGDNNEACTTANACTETTDICVDSMCYMMSGESCTTETCVPNAECGATSATCDCMTGYVADTDKTCKVADGYLGGACTADADCTTNADNSACVASVCACATGYSQDGASVTACAADAGGDDNGSTSVIASLVLLGACVGMSHFL